MIGGLRSVIAGKLYAWVRLVLETDGYGIPLFLESTVTGQLPAGANGLWTPITDDALRITGFEQFDEDLGYQISRDFPPEQINRLYKIGDRVPIPFVVNGRSEVTDVDQDEQLDSEILLSRLHSGSRFQPLVLKQVDDIIKAAKLAEHGTRQLQEAYALSTAKDWERAVDAFERAIKEYVAADELPPLALQRYFEAVRHLGSQAGNRALSFLESMSFERPRWWNEDYYWILHDAERWDDARKYCGRMVANEPWNVGARCYLAHVIAKHLRSPAEAETLLTPALIASPRDANLRFQKAEVVALIDGREIEAEHLLQNLLLEQHILISEDRHKILRRLFYIQKKRGASREELIGNLEEQSQHVSKPADLNNLAWSMYTLGGNLEKAAELAYRSHSADPNDLYATHTLAAILVSQGNWRSASPIVADWLKCVDIDQLVRRWGAFMPIFAEAVRLGRGGEIAEMINARVDRPDWEALRAAVLNLRLTDVPPTAKETVSLAEQISEQLAKYDEKNWSGQEVNWPGHYGGSGIPVC